MPPPVRERLVAEPVWVPLHRRRDAILAHGDMRVVDQSIVEDLKQVLLCLHAGKTWDQLRGEERTQRRRALALTFGVATLLVALSAVAGWQAWEQGRQRRLAESREFAARANLALATDPSQALPLAARAADLAETIDAQLVLSEALTLSMPQAWWRTTTPITSLDVSPDGALIAASDAGGTIRVFDTRTGREAATLAQRRLADLLFSPDSRLLVGVGGDGFRIWRMPSAALALTQHVDGDVMLAVFSPDANTLFTANDRGELDLWRTADGAHLWSVSLPDPPPLFQQAAFSPDGTSIVLVSDATRSGIFEAATGRARCTLKAPRFAADAAPTPWRLIKSDPDVPDLTAAAFHPTEPLVITAGEDGVARLWRTANCLETARLHGHQGRVNVAVFSPDGRRILTAGDDGRAVVWKPFEGDGSVSLGEHNPFVMVDVRRQKLIGSALASPLVGHVGAVDQAIFSRAGDRIITAGLDQKIRVWHGDGVNQITSIAGHTDYITRLALVGSDRVASAARDGTLRVSQLRTLRDGRSVRIQSVTGAVNIIRPSPDGRVVAVGSPDGMLQISDASTGALVRLLMPRSARQSSESDSKPQILPTPTYATFSRDGREPS